MLRMFTEPEQFLVPSEHSEKMSSIIILVHNVKTRDEIINQTRNCLDTLASTIDVSANEVILVDNGSLDDGLAYRLLEEKKSLFPQSVILRSEENRHISTWWNDCIVLAKHDEIVLVNNDVIFHSPAWLPTLINPIKSPNVGAAGSHMLGWNGINFLEGAFLAFRKSFVQALLGERPFDEQFEFTCEDLDFCYRLSSLGRSLVPTYIEQSGYVTHLGHGTLSWSNEEGGWNGKSILNVMHDGRRKICKKYGLTERIND